MLEIKNIIVQMNACDGLMSRLNVAKERMRDLDNMSVETFQNENL